MLSRLVAVVAACAAALAATPEKPQRIASLNLAADEILVEILPLERLVAATEAADDPHSSSIVGRIPISIPRFFRADLERLVALRPDLVVVSEYTDADFLAALERSGLRHHRMEGLNSMAGYRRAMLELGRVVGELEAAERLVQEFDARLAQIAARLEDAPRPRVLYWANPFTAGEGTAIGALIECAGGRNVGRELGVEGVVPIGAERTYAANPDLLLVALSPGDDGRVTLAEHPLLSQLAAVRDGRVVTLPMHLLVSVSHHAAGACDALARQLHPEREAGP